MEVTAMESKILTFPISEGSGKVQGDMGTLMDTTIKQLQDGMETLMDAANDIPEDLLIDSGVSGASAENWNRYKQIVRGIFAADDAGWGLLMIQYRQEPSMVENFATVAITLPNDRPFSTCAMDALAMAFVLADKVTTSTDDGKAQICFTVRDIHYAAPSFWD